MVRRGDEAGTAAVEYTGMVAAGVAVALALLLVVATVGPTVAGVLSWALCEIRTMGAGPCGTAAGSASRKPPDPCVVKDQSVDVNAEVDVLILKAADGRRLEVARLSDGRYRVTRLERGDVGAGTGVGGGLSLTIADRTAGFKASADASATLDVSTGDVYYTSDRDAVDRMIQAEVEDSAKDLVASSTGVRAPARWVLDRGEGVVNTLIGRDTPTFPEPDETFSQGGAVLDLSAEFSAMTLEGSASIGVAQVVGTRTYRNGSSTTYFRDAIDAGAGVQARGGQLEQAGAAGSVEVVIAVTYDADGVLQAVSVSGAAAGEAEGPVATLFDGSGDGEPGVSGAVLYEATVPVRNDADRRVAEGLLAAGGVAQVGGIALAPVTAPLLARAVPQFLDAARDRGYLTRQTFSTDDSTLFDVDASGKLGIELGANVSVESASRTSTGAAYWDGTAWVARSECRL
ncbi:MAG TPA: hypothetical protein VFJ85_14525 [Acidimicrobiales bacterium]|nr:hypothetical protein [Acidimicrobiales bacterium]